MHVSKDGDAFAVSFLLQDGAWDNPAVVRALTATRIHLDRNTFPDHAVLVRLCDDHLTVKKALE